MVRDQVMSIVREYIKNENLINHMLSVEAAMRFYATLNHEDPDEWGNADNRNDFDWEIQPNLE